jgi:glycosyltransferase involved in cell wall biosynthesis
VRPLAPATDARAVVALRRELARFRPDIVHTHMAKAGTLTRTAARTMRHRPALVHTFHGHVLEGYFRPAVQRAFIEVERALARMTDVLVAVSPHVRDDLLELRIGRPEQYRVIPLGFDLDAHRRVDAPSGELRARLGLGPDVPLVGCVGRLVPIKDVPTLLAAMVAVPDAHLALVGDGELRTELEARVESLGLDGRVHFTGWLHDIPSLMSDLDVVALSSRNEGTPVALIEAGACARAVVATDVGGVRSVVEDGVNGLVVPPADPAALGAAITHLLGDPARRAAMGAAGRRASARFDQDRLVSDVRVLYADLLTSRAR